MLVIIDDQRAPTAQIRRWQLPVGTCLASAKLRGEPEGGTDARFAFYADLSAHQLGKLLGDRQAKSGSAILACG